MTYLIPDPPHPEERRSRVSKEHLSSEPPAWTAPYLGIPFADLGRDFAGCDCYGAGRLVMMHERGVQLPMHLEYEDARDAAGINRLLERELAAQAAWRPVNGPLEAFDWLVLRRRDLAGALSFHLAVVSAPPQPSGAGGWVFHTLRGAATTNERMDAIAFRMEGTVCGRYRYAPEDR